MDNIFARWTVDTEHQVCSQPLKQVGYDTDQDPKASNEPSKLHPEMAQELRRQLETWRKLNKIPLPPSSSQGH